MPRRKTVGSEGYKEGYTEVDRQIIFLQRGRRSAQEARERVLEVQALDSGRGTPGLNILGLILVHCTLLYLTRTVPRPHPLVLLKPKLTPLTLTLTPSTNHLSSLRQPLHLFSLLLLLLHTWAHLYHS